MGSKGKIKKRSEQIAQEVLDFIACESLDEGDRLPSERKLSEQLGVCRSSLREGLRLLEAAGYVEVETGRGCFVGRGPSDAGLRVLAANSADISELVELRSAVAPKAASLAAQRRSMADVDDLRGLVRRLWQARERQDYGGVAQASIDLGSRIAQASGNNLLVQIMGDLSELTQFLREILVRSPRTVDAFCGRLTRVVEAIAQADWSAAREHMYLHVTEGVIGLDLIAHSAVDRETLELLDSALDTRVSILKEE